MYLKAGIDLRCLKVGPRRKAAKARDIWGKDGQEEEEIDISELWAAVEERLPKFKVLSEYVYRWSKPLESYDVRKPLDIVGPWKDQLDQILSNAPLVCETIQCVVCRRWWVCTFPVVNFYQVKVIIS